VDDLGVLGKPGLVLDAARDDGEVARAAHAPLVAEAELHRALEHPEYLLVRVAVCRGVSARPHAPEHDHLLLPDEDAARDLVPHLFFGEQGQTRESLHGGDRHDMGLLGSPKASIAAFAVKRPDRLDGSTGASDNPVILLSVGCRNATCKGEWSNSAPHLPARPVLRLELLPRPGPSPAPRQTPR